jgi:hypothetical protein
VAALVLRPQIQKDPNTQQYRISKASITGSGAGPFAGLITLRVSPPIGRDQRVALLLNQVQPASGQPAAYQFNAEPRDPVTAPPTNEAITIRFQGVNQGTYLVRIQVDGAESPLDFAAGQYTGPLVAIP